MSGQFNLEVFEKAVTSLNEVFKEKRSVLVRDATIQRFEYTFELSWKILKRYFKLNNNVDLFNVKEIFREAGKQGLINNVEQWFEYLEAWNLTSHTYDEKTADRVYDKAKQFKDDSAKLLANLKKLIEK